MSTEELNVIHRLIRRVGCAFYEIKDRILLDALLKHSALRDDHLSIMMDMQLKEVRKICGGLKEDRMIDEYEEMLIIECFFKKRRDYCRTESKEGYSRPIGRTYYFINYRATIDAIKWKMHKLVKTVDDRMRKARYICPTCTRQYTSLDAVSLVSPDWMNFLCIDCGTALKDNEESFEVADSQERLSRLMNQMSKIISSLKEVDEIVVPDNTFNVAMANAIPPSIDSASFPEYMEPAPLNTVSSTTSHAVTISEPSISIDYDSELKVASKPINEKQQKSDSFLQNDIPIWHSRSTVINDLNYTSNVCKNMNSDGFLEFVHANDSKSFEPVKEKQEAIENAVAEYYAKLRAQKDTQIKNEIEDMDDDDDFDNDFEDFNILETEKVSNDNLAYQSDVNHTISD
ncbi:hypothetical protein PORY_000701 [Pneumocystis oryctolagi]|uniref:Uncharacterized protein n=1 Tax=Pneumocystis oryctolagi TaxID=42067 RepID=A0ACB7CDE9_9ASCO|nr:hypothetical protein PORY_000701 [Pneumocystis oryctolagi]